MGQKCRFCNKRFAEECSAFCSAECMAKWLESYREEIEKSKLPPADGIESVIRMQQQIEKRTGKRISYGELMARGKTDGD